MRFVMTGKLLCIFLFLLVLALSMRLISLRKALRLIREDLK